MEKEINKSFYYIAYSFIEDQKSANQIQSKNTYENLKKITPSLKGIFLGNQKSLFWKIRKEKDKYFIDRMDYKIGIIEKYLKMGILRKNFFPFLFALKVGKILKKNINEKNIYTRLTIPEEGIFYLKRLNKLNIKKIIFELHNLTFDIPNFYYWNFERKYCYRKYLEFFNLLKTSYPRTKLVTVTKILAKELKNNFDYQYEIEVIPDAHNFEINKPKDINFNKGKIEIIYTGLTFHNRGMECLIEGLNFLDESFFLRLVGGQDEERKDIFRKYHSFIKENKLILEKPVSNKEIREKLLKADIAVIPLPRDGHGKFTSPLKLFEYTSVGIPIISSDTSTLREILTEENALFFEPNNSRDLAKKIEYLIQNEKMAKNLSQNAFKGSKKYTYQKRSEKILELLK